MKQHTPQFLESFKKLVAMPSISCIDPALDQGNQGVIELLANWLEDAGFRVELMPLAGRPGKANLIACLGSGEGGLVLSGHTDTVPCNESQWQQDPFLLTERDNKLYGLGATDMKCFFPMVLEVIRTMNLKKTLQPIYILATADEESTMGGARALVDAGRKLGRYALIGEPTGLKPVHMHKGILGVNITLTGRAGHASNPALGISALEGMHAVIGGLMAWRKELQQQYIDGRFAVPVPTLNFGSIKGGDSPNRICAECALTVDMRLLPEMNMDIFQSEMIDVIQHSIAGSGLELDVHSLFHSIPHLGTDAHAEIIRVAEKVSGHTATTVAFGTEGPYLNAMGMETVVLGPGDIDVAHQANEYIATDRIQPMLEILTKMIGHFCVEEMKYVN